MGHSSPVNLPVAVELDLMHGLNFIQAAGGNVPKSSMERVNLDWLRFGRCRPALLIRFIETTVKKTDLLERFDVDIIARVHDVKERVRALAAHWYQARIQELQSAPGVNRALSLLLMTDGLEKHAKGLDKRFPEPILQHVPVGGGPQVGVDLVALLVEGAVPLFLNDLEASKKKLFEGSMNGPTPDAIAADKFEPEGNDGFSSSIVDLFDSLRSPIMFLQDLQWSDEDQEARFFTLIKALEAVTLTLLTSPNECKPIPVRVPSTALISGPIAGGSFPPSADTPPRSTQSFSPESARIPQSVIRDQVNGQLQDASVATFFQAWIDKLEWTEYHCVEIWNAWPIFDLWDVLASSSATSSPFMPLFQAYSPHKSSCAAGPAWGLDRALSASYRVVRTLLVLQCSLGS
ncbi:hypothetical protein BC827DRAFT_1269747 [Russula dissimulans]|nr:hypothetical protein BC827DRAFT_1269747 [Russula dissimulans]